MAYTPPVGNVVAIALAGAYSVPAGDVVALALQDPIPPEPVPTRYTGSAANLPWSRAPARLRAVRARYSLPGRCAGAVRAPWAAQDRLGGAVPLPWAQVPTRNAHTRLRWTGDLAHAVAFAGLPWRAIPRKRSATGMPWGLPPVVTIATGAPWRGPPRVARATTLPWSVPPRGAVATGMPWSAPPALTHRWWLPWNRAPAVRWVVHGPGVVVPPEPPTPHYVPPRGDRVALKLTCPQLSFDGSNVAVPLGPAACYFAWPQPRTYIVLNTASVVRLPERTPIAVSSVSVRSGIDDLYWSIGLTLADPAHLALLQADGDGPKVVEINLNGYVWTGIIEAYDQGRQFPTRTVTVSGRSQTALLDSPYAPVRAKVQTADRQAQQLVDEELDLTGFTADYATLTWLVPGGTWHYESSTPIAAVREIAAAAGSVVMSHPWDTVLQVVPRYPVSPWDWLLTAPDKQIQDDIILRDQLRLASKPLYDYVLVSGEQVGVSDPIQRTGSAGDVRAPMVVDKLITEHPVSAERGRNVLSDRGEQALVSLDIPLFPSSVVGQPGLVLPLQLVEVVEAAAWKALAVGCDIRADVDTNGALVIVQTVSLERHYSDAN